MGALITGNRVAASLAPPALAVRLTETLPTGPFTIV
jgi:hypothetical protein